MPKKKTKKQELDSTYFLKLILYVVIGSQWVRVTYANTQVPIPVGLIIGMFFASHEHFQIDRKIEYAVLLMAMLVGLISQAGVFINL